jgi:hypothetical protein
MPHRNMLLKLLESYEPSLPEEITARQEILSFVKAHANCFLRENLFGHITASSWILSPDRTEVLLCHHRKLDKWVQLGGHADGDNDVLRVSLKEAEEESGIAGIRALSEHIFDLDIHIIPQWQEVPKHFHFDIRFLLQAPTKKFTISPESKALAWVNLEDIISSQNYSASLKRMAKKLL